MNSPLLQDCFASDVHITFLLIREQTFTYLFSVYRTSVNDHKRHIPPFPLQIQDSFTLGDVSVNVPHISLFFSAGKKQNKTHLFL